MPSLAISRSETACSPATGMASITLTGGKDSYGSSGWDMVLLLGIRTLKRLEPAAAEGAKTDLGSRPYTTIPGQQPTAGSDERSAERGRTASSRENPHGAPLYSPPCLDLKFGDVFRWASRSFGGLSVRRTIVP